MKHFHHFTESFSELLGSRWTLVVTVLIIVIWFGLGIYFQYSTMWQYIIHTLLSICTFIMVIVIQNTQNRHTKELNIKINELIKASGSARNRMLDLNKLSDSEIKQLENMYKKLCAKHESK